MKCNCCGRPITSATCSGEHVYRLPVYELVEQNGQLAALRVGSRSAAVCAACVQRIHAAAERRSVAARKT